MATFEHEKWFAPGGGAESVAGFLTPLASQFMSILLSHQLEETYQGSLVEIGTYMGKTFIGLAKASRESESVVGLDLFPPEVETAFKESIKILTASQLSRLSVIKKNSLAISIKEWMALLRQPARFVHIDGGHNYKAIINDLCVSSSYLTENALVIIDDFMHDWYPDLTEGIIDGLKASRNLVPVAIAPRLEAPRKGRN